MLPGGQGVWFLIKIHLKLQHLAAKLLSLQYKLPPRSRLHQHLEHITFPLNQSSPVQMCGGVNSALCSEGYSAPKYKNLSFEDFPPSLSLSPPASDQNLLSR